MSPGSPALGYGRKILDDPTLQPYSRHATMYPCAVQMVANMHAHAFGRLHVDWPILMSAQLCLAMTSRIPQTTATHSTSNFEHLAREQCLPSFSRPTLTLPTRSPWIPSQPPPWSQAGLALPLLWLDGRGPQVPEHFPGPGAGWF